LLTSVPVTGITNATPAVVTVPAHNMPQGWPCALIGVAGMIQINAPKYPPRPSDYQQGNVVDENTIALNGVSSNNFSAYLSGGDLVYATPVPLVGMGAQLTIWDTPDKNDTPLVTLTLGSGITIDTDAFTISPVLQTAGLPWTQGYFDLDMTDASGIVTRILTGTLEIN